MKPELWSSEKQFGFAMRYWFGVPPLQYLEAVVQRCSVKNVFLKTSQNSQENNLGLQLY